MAASPPFKEGRDLNLFFFSSLHYAQNIGPQRFPNRDDLKSTFWCSSCLQSHLWPYVIAFLFSISVFSDDKSQCFGIQTAASQPFPVFVCWQTWNEVPFCLDCPSQVSHVCCLLPAAAAAPRGVGPDLPLGSLSDSQGSARLQPWAGKKEINE